MYFTEHCYEKPFFHEGLIDPVSAAIEVCTGPFYWDYEKENLNFLYEPKNLVFPFGLDRHDPPPGYYAFVATCFPLTYDRFDQDRFDQIPVEDSIPEREHNK